MDRLGTYPSSLRLFLRKLTAVICIVLLTEPWVIYGAVGSGGSSAASLAQARAQVFPNQAPPGIQFPPFAGGFDFQSCMTQATANAASTLTATIGQSASFEADTGVAQSIREGLGTLQGASPFAQCPKAGDVDSNYSCDDFKTGSRFSATKAQTLLRQVSTAVASAACEKAKISALKGILGCVQQQVTQIENQISNLSSAFITGINQFQEDVAKYDAIEKDLEEQVKDANSYLNGGGTRGRGWIALKNELDQLVQRMPAQITEIENEAEAIEAQKRAFNDQLNIEKRKRAIDCFTKEQKPSYKCGPNLPPVAAKDFILCRTEQNATLSKDGTKRRTDEASKAKAQALKVGLESVLDRMEGKVEDFDSSRQSIADVDRVYGPQLKGFQVFGINVYNFVMKRFGACFVKADKTVERDRAVERTDNALGKAQFDIKKAQRDTKSKGATLMLDFGKQFADVTRALRPNLPEVPLNSTSCQQMQPKQQVGCLKNLKGVMEGLLTGGIDQAKTVIPVQGTLPQTQFEVHCAGLNGCIQEMRRTVRDREQKGRQTKLAKEAYVRNANRLVQQVVVQQAAQLNSQSRLVQQNLAQINSALSSIGVSAPNLPSVRPEQLRFDSQTGLVQAPQDVKSLIGGLMNPPLLDTARGGFSTAISALGTQENTRNENLTKAQNASRTIVSTANGCIDEEIKKAAQEYLKKLGEWSSNNCNYLRHYCASSPQDTLVEDLENIANDLEDQRDQLRAAGVSPSTLTSGLSSRMCKDRTTIRRFENLRDADSHLDALEGLDTQLTRTIAQEKSTLEGQKSTLESQIRTKESDLTNLRSAINAHNTAMAARTPPGTPRDMAAETQPLMRDLDRLRGELATLNQRIGSVNENSDIASIKTLREGRERHLSALDLNLDSGETTSIAKSRVERERRRLTGQTKEIDQSKCESIATELRTNLEDVRSKTSQREGIAGSADGGSDRRRR